MILRMRKPISIIVIAHHNHITLEACLNSIEKNSLEIDQLILVGDNINQKVFEIFLKYKNWQIIRIEKNSPAAARNEGARYAKHDFIAFFDDDVHVQLGWFETMLEKIEKTPWIVLGQSKIIIEDEDNRILKLKEEIKNNREKENKSSTRLKLGSFQYGLDSAAILVRRSWHNYIGGFDEKMRVSEDTDYTLRTLLLGGDFFYTNNTYVKQLKNPTENIIQFFRKYFLYGKVIPYFSAKYCLNLEINKLVIQTFKFEQSFDYFLLNMNIFLGLMLSNRTWQPFLDHGPKASPNYKKNLIEGCSPYFRQIYWEDNIISYEVDPL
jgi:GT2 family glycosyltransferase